MSKKFRNKKKRPGVFLDRDGTINYDYGYTYKFSEFKFRPNVINGLRFLTKKKYLIFIVTNQAGIAKGKFKLKDLKILNKKLIKFLLTKKVTINEIQYCPYHPEGTVKKYKKKTAFRKPGNLMIKSILKKWNINIKLSFMIGDKQTDKIAAQKSKLYFNYAKSNFLKQVKNIDKKISNSC